MHHIRRPPVHQVVLWQLVITGFLGLIFFLVSGITSGYSALIGGSVCWVPNLYFCYKFFRHMGARSMHHFLADFYVGESWKLILTAIFFGAAFAAGIPVNVVALFLSYILVLVTGIFMASRVTLKK